MRKEEIERMPSPQQKERVGTVVKKGIVNATPGLIRNVSNIREGIRLTKIIKELGLKGKIYYKSFKNEIYVILKGYPGLRKVLTGTRYKNFNPKIVRFGLSKVSFATAVKGTFLTSFAFYGLAKVADGVAMYLEDGELRPGYFSEIPADVIKLFVTSFAATAAGVGIVAWGAPVAVGIGIALVMGIVADAVLDNIDEQTGFTKAVSEATKSLAINLKKDWENFHKSLEKKASESILRVIENATKALIQQALHSCTEEMKRRIFDKLFSSPQLRGIIPIRLSSLSNPLEGFNYRGSLGSIKNPVRRGNHFVYYA